MAQQTINIGTTANDGTGDPLRTAFDKINDNFTELYTASPVTSQITLEGNEINTNVSNANLVLNGNGTGGVLASSLLLKGTTISSDDSTQIQINENLDVDGNITASGDITAVGNVFAKGNINLGDAAGDQTKVVGVFEADQIQIDGTTITSTVTNGSITVQGNGTGGVNVADVTINDNEITASNSNSDLVLNGSGTGSVKAAGIKVSGTTITSDDSSQIQINEALDVDGTLNVAGATTVAAITASGVATFSGTAVVDNITINDSTISTSSNADLNLTPGGTGSVVAGGVAIKGTTLSAPDSSTININEGLVVDGTANVSGTLTTADISTTGANTISGALTAGSVNVGDLNILSDGSITSDTNGDIVIDPAGTGAIVLTGPITATGTQTTTGQLNVDNLRMDGNTISATSGGMTIDAAAGQNITFNKKIAAGDIDVTLLQATTARVDTLQNDTSNGDISISTQGTGVVDFNTATQTTVGSAGAASALPGTPTGYLEVKIGGTARVIPFYDKS